MTLVTGTQILVVGGGLGGLLHRFCPRPRPRKPLVAISFGGSWFEAMSDAAKVVLALGGLVGTTLGLVVLGYFKTGMNLGAVLHNIG